MVRIYTRRGDQGETGLLFGGRVSKSDLRCEAYGTIDEAVSALGVARSISQDEYVRDVVRGVQKELFIVGGELATDASKYEELEKHFRVVTAEMVSALESLIDQTEREVDLPRAFVVPGASSASASLDLARSIVRRAERYVVRMKDEGLLANPYVLVYLNRLADLVFMLARYQDRSMPYEALVLEDG